MNRLFATLALLAALTPAAVLAHCQMPCGIYDDAARLATLREDVTTIEKAVAQIGELAGKTDAQSANQLVRWINTKDEHAGDIMTIVSEYFLAQRVKPVAPGAEGYQTYLAMLGDHHQVIVAAMKAKQNAGAEAAGELRKAVETLAGRYPAH